MSLLLWIKGVFAWIFLADKFPDFPKIDRFDFFMWSVGVVLAGLFVFVFWQGLIIFFGTKYWDWMWLFCSIGLGCKQGVSIWPEQIEAWRTEFTKRSVDARLLKRIWVSVKFLLAIVLTIFLWIISVAVGGLMLAMLLVFFLSPSPSDCIAGRYC